MHVILTTVVPVFSLIALGFAAAKFAWFSRDGARGLSFFVNYFAIPALLFRTMARIDLGDAVPWALWGSYYLASLSVWIIAVIVSRRVASLNEAGGAPAGMSSTFGNLVLMGIPLAYVYFGEAALIPAALIVAIHAPAQWFGGTLWAEWSGRAQGQGLAATFGELAQNLLKNPIIMSLVAGLAWNLSGFALPELADKTIELLGQAGVPTALFALGLSIAAYSFRGQAAGVATILTLKMLVMPAIVWVLVHYVFALSPLTAAIVVLFAGLPPGVNAYLFAERCNASVAPVSGAVALGTAISVATVPLALWLIGPV